MCLRNFLSEKLTFIKCFKNIFYFVFLYTFFTYLNVKILYEKYHQNIVGNAFYFKLLNVLFYFVIFFNISLILSLILFIIDYNNTKLYFILL